jgi:hypothetical protein
MIIDSPIISGSYLSTGSLSQTGNVSITGSLTATAGITGSFSGSGADLFGIPATGITGLNLSQISSGSVSASISPNQGLLINTSVSASNFSGSFSGSGADLFGIPATAITGLNLSQISSGSVSASISPNQGLLINTSVSASNFTGSFTGSLTGIATSASYASFALTSSYSLGGSGFPFSGSAVITGSLIVSGSGLTITGSVAISSLTTGSGVRYVIADADGLLSAQTASAAIFTTQQVVSTANQTTFPITNGYSTGYVTVFVNGTKLSADEYVDTSGTNIIFLTGSTAGDVVEFQKYLPAAGVSNNTLRTVNYFTATLGQTDFTVNYTPGLLDVFYNGAKLDNTEYTAANGTSITLATGSNAGDRLEVDVYSYQVGAFSGIGGTGAANQLAYFNTSNSITGSNAFTVSGSAIIITGSLIVSGSGTLINIGPTVFSGSVTSTAGFSGSFSGNADSASLAQNSLLLQGTGSIGFATTASLLAVSSSQQQISSSLLTLTASFTALSSSYTALSGSYNTFSGSESTRITKIENNYATTGSNSFRADQSITGSLVVSSTITAQTLVVQTVTSSILYSSGSNVFGNQLANTQTFTGSVNITGSLTVNTTGTEFQVTNRGVVIGNLLTDTHSITGSLNITGSTTVFAGSIGINGSPGNSFPIESYINSSTTYTSTSRGNVLRVYNSNTTANIYAGIELGGAGASNDGLAGINGIVTGAGSGDLAFYTRNSNTFGEKMRITSAGVTAIAASSNTSDLGSTGLVIGGSSTLTSGNVLMLNFTPIGHTSNRARAGIGCLVGADWGKGNLTFYTQDASSGAAMTTGNERMRITSDGNVGIGTSNPDAKLSILGASNTPTSYGSLLVKNSSEGGISFGASGTSYAWIQGNIYGGSYNFNLALNAQGGNVGIGTTNPSYLLHIPQGNNLFLSNLYITGTASNPILSSGATGGSMYLQGGGTGEGKIYLQGAASGGNGYIEFYTNNSLRMTIASNGNIGAPSGTNIYNASDARLKQNITTITNGLDKVMGLNPVKFNWINNFVESEEGKDMLGFVAQEVQTIIPEAVENFSGNSITIGETTIENPLRVNEKFIIPVLVKAIQELQEKLQRNNIN